MPKAKDDRGLFEKCRGCGGTRKLKVAAHLDVTRTNSRDAQPGEDCPLCADGYFETGITVGQFDATARERDRLLVALLEGDPGGAVADKYRHHLAGARDRLSKGRK